MAITTDLSNSSPMPLDGNAFVEVVSVAEEIFSIPTETISSIGPCSSNCDCAECCYSHEVFGESVYSSDLKNDKYTFKALAREDSGNITFTLQKSEVDLVTITDNTFGTLVDAGGYATNLRLGTFIIDWGTILRTYGEGEYRMKIVTDAIGGGTTTVYSDNFDLKQYENSVADGTVVFEWVQNGKILNSSIDYTGTNLVQYLRLPGNIGFETQPEIIVQEHETAPHEFLQIQDQLILKHVYESELLPFSVTYEVLKDMILANEITATNYNYYDHFVINQKKLKVESVSDFQSYPYNKCAKMKLVFSEKFRNTIKRNYT